MELDSYDLDNDIDKNYYYLNKINFNFIHINTISIFLF